MVEIKTDVNLNYEYHAFGLNITSELPLPELRTCSGIPDVQIRVGKVPKEFLAAVGNQYYQAKKNELLLHLPEVGSFYITHGNQIVVEPHPRAELKTIRLYLLGSSMGAILLQRGILPIHGSALVVGDRCFIVTGAQGAGKSTLAAALKRKGYALLTDDVAAVAFDETGTPWVNPAYPQQKLWRDSLEAMGKSVTCLTTIGGRIDKYAVRLEDGFCGNPRKLAAIYELRADHSPAVRMKRLSPVDKLAVVMNNIYRFGFVAGLDLQEATFKSAAALARQVAVEGISRPGGVFTLEEQIALLEKEFKEWK